MLWGFLRFGLMVSACLAAVLLAANALKQRDEGSADRRDAQSQNGVRALAPAASEFGDRREGAPD